MKKETTRWVILGAVVVIAVAGYMFYSNNQSKQPGIYDDFARCITDNGAKMYGTDWCPHCQDQKEMFGNSFEHVYFIECDRQSQLCQEAGITGYPTWVFADNSRVTGAQPFSLLAEKTGCTLPAN